MYSFSTPPEKFLESEKEYMRSSFPVKGRGGGGSDCRLLILARIHYLRMKRKRNNVEQNALCKLISWKNKKSKIADPRGQLREIVL